ncbi:MAG TPA: LysR family transcriptional regulator [Steroidobacteraceae bacterium]|nr:LysR family transcriptional regulator [Steroidobacteraceae bacterium]
MALTFRKLEVFVAVAEDGNFRRAAERLGISQPSVSSQIKSMERYLGYQLFERRRGATSELSADGRGFLQRARELVAAQSALAAERRRVASAPPVHLRVCVGPLLMDRRIKPGLARFQEAHPNIELEFVSFSPTLEGTNAVRRGETDVLLFTGGMPDYADSVETEVISRINCSLYGAPKLVRPVLQGIRPLDELPFLLLPDHFRFTQWTLEQFSRKGVSPSHIVGRPPFMDVLLQMILAGRGVGVFFDIEIASHMRAGRVLACGPVFDPVARVMMLGPKARVPEAAPLLNFLREAVRREDEAIALQHAQLGRPGLLVADDSFGRASGL